MAAMDHVGQTSIMPPPLPSSMAPPQEFGMQGLGQCQAGEEALSTKQEKHFPNKNGEVSSAAGDHQGQEGEQLATTTTAEWAQEDLGTTAAQLDIMEAAGDMKGDGALNPVEYWQAVSQSLLSTLDDSLNKALAELKQLHDKEQEYLSHIQQLYKSARSMNISFHNQLDSLHTTVLGLVSSIKK